VSGRQTTQFANRQKENMGCETRQRFCTERPTRPKLDFGCKIADQAAFSLVLPLWRNEFTELSRSGGTERLWLGCAKPPQVLSLFARFARPFLSNQFETDRAFGIGKPDLSRVTHGQTEVNAALVPLGFEKAGHRHTYVPSR
jgi:hypothetical protein